MKTSSELLAMIPDRVSVRNLCGAELTLRNGRILLPAGVTRTIEFQGLKTEEKLATWQTLLNCVSGKILVFEQGTANA